MLLPQRNMLQIACNQATEHAPRFLEIGLRVQSLALAIFRCFVRRLSCAFVQINVADYYAGQVRAHLSGDINDMPILKADALK